MAKNKLERDFDRDVQKNIYRHDKDAGVFPDTSPVSSFDNEPPDTSPKGAPKGPPAKLRWVK